MVAPFDMSKLPSKPGCYLFKDILEDVIYIGKAKNIKKRVASYFSKTPDDEKTAQLVTHIKSVDFIVTPSEVQALLLESNLIRQHKPKYNIDLKYGVRYAWILLTDERFPRLLTARNKKKAGEYFGPFVNGRLRRTLIDTLQKKFFIRTCRVLPKKPCLRYHIGLCKAPCVNYQTQDEYNNNIARVRDYLSGDNKKLIAELTEEMKQESANQNYEDAQLLKEQIDALTYLEERTLVENARIEEQDVINYEVEKTNLGEVAHLLVFSFRHGVLQDKEEFAIAYEKDFLEAFLKRYYEVAIPPQEIIIPRRLSDSKIVDFLSKIAGYKVKITAPQRGLKKELLLLASKNLTATQSAAQKLALHFQQELALDQPVRTIECFDISHHGGTSMVGAMSYFKDGKSVKSKYRKFKIKTVNGVDDFRALHEIVYRRYKRLKESKQEFPDLVVIDGGEQQLAFAYKALEELGLSDLAVVALAKKFEELYFPHKKKPLRFDKKKDFMKVIIQARDEAHRFGVQYHRLLKKKKTLQ